MLTANIPNEDGENVLCNLLVPKSDMKVIDIWHVVGMKGTGSNLLQVQDAFVPDHRILEMKPWNIEGKSPGMIENTSSLYRIQLSAVMPVTLLSAILGATKGAYDFWRDNVIGKTINRSGKEVAQMTNVQIRLAKVATKIQAAEALLKQSLNVVESGERLDYAQRVQLRCNYSYAVELCTEAIEKMFMTSGAAVAAESNPLQMYWRDIHAASMHMAFNFDRIGEIFGKLELDLPVAVEY